jgi:hypothetical protein
MFVRWWLNQSRARGDASLSHVARIIQAVGWTPASGLLYQNGCKLVYDRSSIIVVTVTPRMSQQVRSTVHTILAAVALKAASRGLSAALARHAKPALGSKPRRIASGRERGRGSSQMPRSRARQYVVHRRPRRNSSVCARMDEKDVCDAIDDGRLTPTSKTLKRLLDRSAWVPCTGQDVSVRFGGRFARGIR